LIRFHSISWSVAAALPEGTALADTQHPNPVIQLLEQHEPALGLYAPSNRGHAGNRPRSGGPAEPHACAAQRRRGNSVVDLISEIATNELTSRMFGNWDSLSKKNF
jgi:hypothetical protein